MAGLSPTAGRAGRERAGEGADELLNTREHLRRRSGTEEMIQPYLIYLHVISLVALLSRAAVAPVKGERH